MFIDAHQHFWNPARGDYGWMPDNDPILSRPYLPADIASGMKSTGVSKTIVVQAAPSVEETHYLLGIADASAAVAGVVGWINFEDPQQHAVLKLLAKHPLFVGVRPMIQDIPDDTWMLKPEVQWAYEAIIELDLTFDCLGFPRHLPHFHTLLTRYPQMRCVLNHCMKPHIQHHNADNFNTWSSGMSRLAEETNAFCKLSGLVTESPVLYTEQQIKPYTDHVISAFGANRIMWGSDWPVSRLRCEYEHWFDLATRLTNHLESAEKKAIFSQTARVFYRVED